MFGLVVACAIAHTSAVDEPPTPTAPTPLVATPVVPTATFVDDAVLPLAPAPPAPSPWLVPPVPVGSTTTVPPHAAEPVLKKQPAPRIVRMRSRSSRETMQYLQ